MDYNKIFEKVYLESRAYYNLEEDFKHYENFYNKEQIDKNFCLEEHFKNYLLNGLYIDQPNLKEFVREFQITDDYELKTQIENHFTENYKDILYYCVYKWLFTGYSIDYKELYQKWENLQKKAKEELKIKKEELNVEIKELKEELKVISSTAKIYKILKNDIKFKSLQLN